MKKIISKIFLTTMFLSTFILAGCGSDIPDYIDLTTMNSTMVYAQVNDMMVLNSEAYLDKTIKAYGKYNFNSDYAVEGQHFIVINDATLCCPQGIEIMYENDFPAIDTMILIEGKFSKYEKSGVLYYYILITSLTII